ncbi:MAG: glycosyltransferase family 2 protein [Desulfuromonadales bacterium]|nr:glycosyltransferase family 2 protein [Desulfuromonadales bacterium]
MNNDPLVSVVLPTYNRKDIIGRTISSVLQQTFTNLELIIVDDGSTDETREYVESEFVDDRINYLYQLNNGVSSARNTGLNHVNGRYVAFIDSDDQWVETKIEKQLAFFREHPEVGLIFCDFAIVSRDGSVLDVNHRIPRTESRTLTLREVFLDPYLGMPTVMLTRELLASIGGFDEKLCSAEDVDFFLRAAVKAPIGYLHEKLVVVNKTEGSLTTCISASDKILTYENNIFVLNRFVNENKKICDEVGCDVSHAMFELYCRYGRSLLSKKKKVASREKFSMAHHFNVNIESLYLLLKTYLPGA